MSMIRVLFALLLMGGAAFAAASRNDQYVLAQEATFQQRVRSSMIAAAVAIYNEAWSQTHARRAALAVAIMNTPDSYKALFANTVATDTTCSNAVQASAGTALVSPVSATALAACTDAMIDNAVAAQFNTFALPPQ
jgi:hypothetical protein